MIVKIELEVDLEIKTFPIKATMKEIGENIASELKTTIPNLYVDDVTCIKIEQI